MFEAAYAQLRFAASLLLARPFHRPSLNQLVEALIATRQTFGALTATASETLGAPALDEAARQQLQLRRVRLQARRGQQETAYYADRLAGLDAKALTAETLHHLPLTTKAALRAEPTAFVRRGQQLTWRTMTTGTTGQPLSLFFTQHEMESYSALAAISHLLQGTVTPADLVQVSTSGRGTLANTVFMQGCQRAGALVYQTGITLVLPLMDALFDRLGGLPFAPLVAWPLLDEQWVAIGLGDLIMATVFPLVLRREAGQKAGLGALVLTGLALAGLLWLPALGLWQATFPVMVVLGPLQISLYGGWRWWQRPPMPRRLLTSGEPVEPKFGVTRSSTPVKVLS